MPSDLMDRVPRSTLAWLASEENPAVAVLTDRLLLGEPESTDRDALWARRNEYAPVEAILGLMLPDGSWAPPARDYQKYWGSLWQIHLLGELYADGDDARVRQAATYALSRQLPDGSWSCSNKRVYGSIPCLTANVGRALARLGYARDERVIAALAHCINLTRELDAIVCRQARGSHLNGYCHMLTPKLLAFLAEVPEASWPDGASELRDACVSAQRDKAVFRCLPAEARQFQEDLLALRPEERPEARERFVKDHSPLHWGPKPGWRRLGYPLSYNSDVLESLFALQSIGEVMRPEYAEAVEIVRSLADEAWQWKLQTSFNGKMLADVEAKGKPSRWVTFRALRALSWAEE